MKQFKSKEDLVRHGSSIRDISYTEGIEKAFQSISERIVFYEKYKNDITSLSNEHLEIYDLFGIDFNKTHKKFTVEYYNRWLFHFCFDEIIKEAKQK